jgi:2,5-dihydroxypyridine 5,6-dioxygenase
MSQPTFTELCRDELELCGIGAGSTLAVLSQGNARSEYVRAFLDAASLLEATAFNVNLPTQDPRLDGEEGVWIVGETPLAGNRPAIEALKGVDMVVDTVFLLYSPEQFEIQAAGTRILSCIEPVDHLRAMKPTPALRTRVEHGAELLGSARVLRFTNAAGTDVTYRLGAYPVISQYGYTDTPGRWDHWPSGFLFTGAYDDAVDGRVVLAPGDIIFPFKSYVQSPIELTIAAGRITHIDGNIDADLLSEYMASFDDPDAYAIAHIGWGMLETAKWSILAHDRRGMGMHGRSFLGNVLFSTGPNGELGGSNTTLCHIDIPMRNCSLWLDGGAIVVDGDIVVEALRPDTRVPSTQLAR